jgi:hypothetical protein
MEAIDLAYQMVLQIKSSKFRVHDSGMEFIIYCVRRTSIGRYILVAIIILAQVG